MEQMDPNQEPEKEELEQPNSESESVPEPEKDAEDTDISSLLASSGLVGQEPPSEEAGGRPEDVETEAGARPEDVDTEAAGLPEDGAGREDVPGGEELASPIGEAVGPVGVDQDQMYEEMARELGMPFIRLREIEVDMEVLDVLESAIARMYEVFPVRREPDGSILIALKDPLNPATCDDLSIMLNETVVGAVCRPDDLEVMMDEYYSDSNATVESILDGMDVGGLDGLDSLDENSFGDLEKIANEAPVIKMVNLLLLKSILERASDMHLEPYQNSFRIRYRIDGTLHEVPEIPRGVRNAIISRLKVMAKMNIAERRLPQDGRIALNMKARQIQLRVNSLPTVNGESLVMRILDSSMTKIGLEQIGMEGDTLEQFSRVLSRPNGLVLVTGPTGSGKTTTLYAALRKIYSTDLKFITTEEPVEYELPGVVQVNINHNVGLDFAACLRSILRQDPDIIMVGETRDLETAQIAIEASLTGHLVLTTLHTNDAPSTITRLIDMDVEPFLLTSTVEAVLAQRLVRVICEDCKVEYRPDDNLIREMGYEPEQVDDVTFYRGRGCEQCNYIGFRGRIGIFELLVPSVEVREMILEHQTTSAISRRAREEGMRTLRQDGWRKVVRGLTTIDEIIREAH
jgi:type IV pilus assembly protein PilB